MKYGLGIDTGGTYTDAAIFDFETREVLSTAKSITVKEDLTKGINEVLAQLPLEKLKAVKLVSLSTTLATNACVEGKGSRAILILIGCDRDIVRKYGSKYGLPGTDKIIFLSGGHDQQGLVKSEPDWDYLKNQVMEHKDKVDAFAVVELWGIRNTQFEKKAKKLINEWTGKQVVCGHELTDEVNSLKRSTSSLLNAQLIPLINNFMNAVKESLVSLEINAPLVIVRGDGSLMSEEFARKKPVETLLSGPAASVAGGTNLSKRKDCVIVDMGGTTTDLALVRDGIPLLAYEGVSVGSWRTGTRSININTFGLGGDSLIRHSRENDILLGPVRVAPLSWLASKWPEVMKYIRKIYSHKKRHTVSLCELFYLIRDISDDSYYSDEEKDIVNALKNGPKGILELSETAGISIYGNRTRRLEQHGIIMRSGLTPTDIMHLTGDFSSWDKEAAKMGAEIMAFQLSLSLDELIYKVNRLIKERLYYNIVKMLIENEKEDILKDPITSQFKDLIMMSYKDDKYNTCHKKDQNVKGFIECCFSTDLALIGIGAPIHIYLPDVAKLLKAECIIPDNASVANAVGAITGNVTVEEKVIIRPKYESAGLDGYTCYSSVNRKEFSDYNEALNWSKCEASKIAREKALARGAAEVNVVTEVNKNEVALSGYFTDAEIENQFPEVAAESELKTSEEPENNMFLIEVTVTARAIGSLKWI